MRSVRLAAIERSCHLPKMLALIAATVISFAVVSAFPMTAQAETVYCNFASTGPEKVGGAMYSVVTATDEWGEKPYRYAVYVRPVSKRKTSYTIPKTINVKVDGKRRKVPVKVIGRMAFKGCSKAKTVNCKAAIEVIEGRAFYKCASLKAFKSSAAIYEIEKQAFMGCKKLETFKCKPNSIVSIGESAFSGCMKLKVFPTISVSSKKGTSSGCYTHNPYDTVESWVGDYAFRNCKSLKSVTFAFGGGKATYRELAVGIKAFCGCSNLSKISIAGTRRSWQQWNVQFEELSFSGCKKLQSILGLGKLSRAQACTNAFRGTRVPTPRFDSGVEGYFDLLDQW